MESRLISYLYYFNIERDYFECHEYGESLWLDSGRPIVLKGLIQAAVCLYHLHNGNIKGGWKMWQRARGYLSGSLPVYESINLEKLTVDIDEVFSRVPSELYHRIVHPEEVANFQLPIVMVDICDRTIAAQLPSWTPEPLDGREDN